MESNRIQEQIQDLASKIVSLDQTEHNYAVNQYFDAQAVVETDRFTTRGVTNIKTILNLNTATAVSSALIDPQPQWNQNDQIITFSFRQEFEPLKFLSIIPFMGGIAQYKLKVTWRNMKLHTFAEDDGTNGGENNQGRLYVTKACGAKITTSIPFDNYVPYHLFRPVTSILIMTVAMIAAFFLRHPLKEGILSFLYALVVETLTFTWNLVEHALGLIGTDPEFIRTRSVSGADKFLQKTSKTLNDVEKNINARAKKAGLPVEDLQRRFRELRDSASDILSSVTQQLEPAHTPGGGTNPKAPGAPTYAEATKENIGHEGGNTATPLAE